MTLEHVPAYLTHLLQTNALRSVSEASLRQELSAQKSGLKRLLDQKNRLDEHLESATKKQLTKRYLLMYDALLRVVEYLLIQRYRVALGQQAHRGVKNVIFKLFPELNEVLSAEQLQTLVQVRHHAKKESLPPSAHHDTLLDQVLSHALSRASQEFSELTSHERV